MILANLEEGVQFMCPQTHVGALMAKGVLKLYRRGRLLVLTWWPIEAYFEAH